MKENSCEVEEIFPVFGECECVKGGKELVSHSFSLWGIRMNVVTRV